MNEKNLVTIEPASRGTGWWVLVLRDGIENRWPVSFQELKEIKKILDDFTFD
jgi:hypothetical protein